MCICKNTPKDTPKIKIAGINSQEIEGGRGRISVRVGRAYTLFLAPTNFLEIGFLWLA